MTEHRLEVADVFRQHGQEFLDRDARFPGAHFSQQGNQDRDGLGIAGPGENQGSTQAG